MLDTGTVASISELGHREGEDPQLHRPHARPDLLAPDIVEATLDEALSDGVRLHQLAINPPIRWKDSRQRLASDSGPSAMSERTLKTPGTPAAPPRPDTA